MTKKAASTATTYPSLASAAESAVGVMTHVIMDAEVPDARRWELDAASKALHAAMSAHRNWERIVLAKPTGLKLEVDLGPVSATCADCGNRALIIPTPPPNTAGFVICRVCSFPPLPPEDAD